MTLDVCAQPLAITNLEKNWSSLMVGRTARSALKPLLDLCNGITMLTDELIADETITEVKRAMQYW